METNRKYIVYSEAERFAGHGIVETVSTNRGEFMRAHDAQTLAKELQEVEGCAVRIDLYVTTLSTVQRFAAKKEGN